MVIAQACSPVLLALTAMGFVKPVPPTTVAGGALIEDPAASPNCMLELLPQQVTPWVVVPNKHVKFEPAAIWVCVLPVMLVVLTD